jgi:hypothetical protein
MPRSAYVALHSTPHPIPVPMLTNTPKNAPIPAGRSIVSCKKLLVRLKEKHKDDIAKIKNGESFASTSTIGAGAGAGAGGDLLETPKSTPRKRKSKDSADVGVGGGGAADGEEGVEGSPKKKGKAASRPRKKKDVVKEEVKEEERDGLDDFEAELV